MAKQRKPRITLTCQTCDKSFQLVPWRATGRRFCSKSCNLKCGRLKPLLQKVCEYCGEAFEVAQHESSVRFCSRKCANTKQPSPAQRRCGACGCQFTPHRARRTQKYCKRACYFAAIHRPTIACAQCKNIFEPKTRDAKFCTPSCQQLASRKRAEKACAHCGNTFTVLHGQRERRQHCSKQCQLKEQFHSKEESRIIGKVAAILGETPARQQAFAWLRSDANRPMYVDAYFPRHNLVVEYDGRHHFQFEPHYHRTPEGFKANQRRDTLKEQLITLHGINFLRIRFDESHSLTHLTSRLRDLNGLDIVNNDKVAAA